MTKDDAYDAMLRIPWRRERGSWRWSNVAPTGPASPGAETSAPDSQLLMVDPSLLLSGGGVAWLEDDPTADSKIIISRALVDALTGPVEVDRDLSPFLAPDDWQAFPERRRRVIELIEGVPVFSYLDVDLPRDEAGVRDGLVGLDATWGRVLADEWAFLVSQSWLAGKRRYVLDKFRDAGAAIVEYGRRFLDQVLSTVVPSEHVPEVLTVPFLVKVGVKWVVVGGPTAGALWIPPVAMGSLAAIPFVRAFDP